MVRKRKNIRLSGGEMELMSMLWEESPVTISEAHEAFSRYGAPVGYPTMQTRLNRLVDKALVRKTNDRPARYQPTVTMDQVALGHLDQLLDKLAGASVAPLVCHLISEGPLSADEIEELRTLLNKAERSS